MRMKIRIPLVVIFLLFVAGGFTRLDSEPLFKKPASFSQNREFLEFNLFDGNKGMVLPSSLSGRISKAESNPLTRGLLHGYMKRKFGLITFDREMIGLTSEVQDGTEVHVFGCAACHSGKAAGLFIPGLGNKTFDVFQGGHELESYLQWERRVKPEQRTDDSSKRSAEFAAIVGNPGNANATRGIVNDVLVWQRLDPAYHHAQLPPAFVKIPAVWGFATKTKAGFFCDGFGEGIGWMAAVPLSAGLSENAILDNQGKLETIERIFRCFEAPMYPFKIPAGLRTRGAAVFAENCRRCHGDYARDDNGRPVYQTPRWISIESVKTDRTRLQFPKGFFDALEENPLHPILYCRADYEPGYLAPRLEGIWSRFPYLHNGSVPSLEALLTIPGERPEVFSMKNAGEQWRFNEVSVGLRAPARGSVEMRLLKNLADRGDRNIYDTSRLGLSNEGHPFGTLLPAADKRALIEYLKSL